MPVQRGPCHWKVFRRSCVHSKGVILLLIWNVFQYWSFVIVSALYGNIAENTTSSSIIGILKQISYLTVLLYPLIGWVADTWLGRYKVVTASLYITMLGVVLVAIAYMISTALPHNSTASVVIIVLVNCGYVVTLFAEGTFIVTMLPYIIDQLVGAPAEELSAGVFWWWWSHGLGVRGGLFVYFLYPLFKFWIITGLVSVTIPVVTHLLLKQWLVRVPVLANPIKHIAKVLNYARKNKCPRNRSALTYWEDDYPSRVDLGKNKYGGPFTEEEVEDVKTVLRLLPLLIPVAVSELFDTLRWTLHYSRTSERFFNEPMNSDWSQTFILILFLIWQLLLYPFFHSYVPNMLKRIGSALFILVLAYCAYAILELIGHSMDHSVGCFLDNNKNSTKLPISVAWLLVPQIMTDLSKFILTVTTLEFIVAQAPIQIRAFMIGLWYAVTGFFRAAGNDLKYAFNHIPSSSIPSCGFYYFMSKTVLQVTVLLLFVFLSRRYRLRERNIPVNYHLFAENYYDKYINIAREMERERLEERDFLIQ